MKYMGLEITVFSDADSRIQLKLKYLHESAMWIRFSTYETDKRIRRKGVYGEEFYEIGRNYRGELAFNANKIYLPKLVQDGDVAVCEEVFRNSLTCQETVSRMIECLYYWDKRCSRSVNVKPKNTVDIPLAVHIGQFDMELYLKDMLDFAKYIQVTRKGD